MQSPHFKLRYRYVFYDIIDRRRYPAELLKNLEAFSVNNGWARFVIFVLGDPHILECGQGRKNTSSNPDGVFSFRWSDNLDFDGSWGQRSHFLMKSLFDAREHSGSSRQHNVRVQISTDIDIALKNTLIGKIVDTGGFFTD